MIDLDSQSTQAHLLQIGIESSRASAFGYLDEAANTRYCWHKHSRHQLLYALGGEIQLEAEGSRYFLQPRRAAWISAGTLHRTTLGAAAGVSVFFRPQLIAWTVEPVCIFTAPPLLRAMVNEASRWPARSGSDEVRDPYFQTLALLCRQWMRQREPLRLPNSTDPQLSRAIDYTLRNLADAVVEQASAAAAMSVRTFRRHFTAALGLTWREYLAKARLLLAMELLARPSARVTTVASQVGYDSPSAFSKAFYELTGETPRAYRLRTLTER